MTRRACASLLVLVLTACAPTPMPHRGSYHGSDADLTVTRIAHAGLLLDFQGERVLVDPWLYGGLFARHREPLGLHPDAFPAASAVLVTDDGATHFDATALARLARTVPRIVAPPALHRRLGALGFREVVELAWWQDTQIEGVRVTATPAHGNGYLLRHGDTVVCLTGEPSTATHFADVRRAAGHVDVAVLPIGGRRVLGMRAGVTPSVAAAAAATLGARRVVPIAYGAAGTFPFVTFLSDPLAHFRDAARTAGLVPEQIVVLEPGESWHFYR